ncbi:uncharacterized protein LOC143296153 [Babylonia areolata]|uniref:uncharacterized protein LOC143296153 n=1 Tax=Babylonia areolata TaxID=304850 RepID=UPI003FD4ABE0
MATNFSVKKSSIPRATHDNDRLDQSKSRLRGPKPPIPKPTNHSHSQQSKPSAHDGLLKEDEDAVRRSLLELEADHARMKQTLEDTVREAEERLVAMEKLMAEREKLVSAASERNEMLENQVETYEKVLIENNIDPVTGEAMEPTAATEKKKKVTKGDVSKVREKLRQMNKDSDKYLTDVQTTLQEIDELQSTSQRVSDTSHLKDMSRTEFKALVQRVEDAQQKEEQEKRRKERKEKGEEEEEEGDVEEEEEEEEEQTPSPTPRQEEENVQPPSKPDVFITQKR